MTTATLQSSQPASPVSATARGELALTLQEAFTVAVRLRAGRQVAADATSFRAHIKQLLAAADQRARAGGYDGETVKLAVYAYIALLDESVLTSTQPMFSEWSRQPLQEEVFGEHMAGETFFRTIQELLGRQDSEALADLLEVYQLCLLLGFHGRYGIGDPGGLHAVASAMHTKIERIRGGVSTELVPDWALPAQETVELGNDRWVRRLTLVAGATLAVAATLYVLYRLLLGSAVAGLRAVV
jgi:type VI secretion system protein ImpK